MKQRLWILPLAAALASCGGSSSSPRAPAPVDTPPPVYLKVPVKDPQLSAAFLDVADLNNDGVKEIVLSTLIEVNAGPPNASTRGALRIFESSNGTLEGPWEENLIISTTDAENNGEGWPFINTPQVMDINEDGIQDLLVQTGFLLTNGGAHFGMLGSDTANLSYPHDNRVYFDTSTRKEFSDNYYWHESVQTDLDDDGRLDIVTTSGQTQRPENPLGSPVCDESQQPNGRCAELKVEWYRNTGNTNPVTGLPEFEYYRIQPQEHLGGVFIKMHDIDRDGDQDIALSQFFGPPQEPSLVWLEQVERPAPGNGYQGVWTTHVIDSTIGLGYHMEFVDIDMDGEIELVAGNHNNQDDPRLNVNGEIIFPGMFWFEIPADPTATSQWDKRVINDSFRVTINYGNSPHSQGVPGIFNVGDINNDGLPDIAVPGDGNDKLYALIQRPDGSFDEHIVDTALQFGMAIVTDVDGDGSNEIVAAQHNSTNGDNQRVDFPPGMLNIYKFPE